MNRRILAAIGAWAAACGAWGDLTPVGVQRDLEAITTGSLLKPIWGLVPPERLATVAEIKDLPAEGHPDLTLLPASARVAHGALAFTLSDTPAVVGAWNCGNRLPPDRRPNFGEAYTLEVELEQSTPGETVWTLTPWYNNRKVAWTQVAARATASAKSANRDVEAYLQAVVYQYCRRTVAAAGRQIIRIEDTGWRDARNRTVSDGLELEIRGPAGTEIRIYRITVSQRVREGGFRKEFTLPDGPVWQAVGGVNRRSLLTVNGREVPSGRLDSRPTPGDADGQRLQEVDLKPFLTPGLNVLAVYPAFPKHANAMIEATVIMASGEGFTLNTDTSWRYVPARAPGWDTTGYAGATEAITNTAPNDAPTDVSKVLSAIPGGWRPHMQSIFGQPPYAGRLRLLAPDDTQLYFSDTRPFRALAHAPAGLAGRQPSVDWLLCRYRKDAPLETAASGTATAFSRKGDSIEFELDGGGTVLPAGAYVLKAVLKAGDGTVLEDRIPEPCLVTGRIPMEPTDGRSFEDGMDLESEAAIDFTKPDDPAFPSQEMSGTELREQPALVTRNSLTFRETGRTAFNSIIMFNHAFKHPGDFYLMELDYPDDEPRFFGVGLCSEHDGPGDHSKAGPSVWTGIGHLNTGTMQTLRWLFRPDPGYTSISLINLLPGTPAAASALRIRRVKGRLPELRTRGSERGFGILTEHSAAHCGFGKTFRSSDRPVSEMGGLGSTAGPAQTNRPAIVRLAALAQWLDTCQAYAEYLRWAGQNLICLSFFQYTGSRANAAPGSATGDHRLVPQLNDIAARVFRDNGIDFYCSIGYCSDPILQAHYAGSTDVSDSPYLINADGLPSPRVPYTGYNFNHPAVRQAMLEVAGEAVRKYQRLPNFRGVNLVTSFHAPHESPNYFIDDRRTRLAPLEPLRYDYSDVTVAKFEKDTGTRLPIPANAPDRFQQRYALLTAEPLREQWIEWRSQNMLAFFLDFRDRLRESKPDVKLATGLDASAGYFFEYAASSGKTAEESMREFGWDFPKFHGQEGLYTIPWLQAAAGYDFTGRFSERSDRYQKHLEFLRANTEPAFLKIADGDVERMAMVHYGWLELERSQQEVFPERPHWQVPFQYTLYGAPQGNLALEPFLQATAAADPDSVFYGFTDTNLKIGNEQPLREFAQFLRSLPKAKFERAPGADSDLVVRTLRQDGRLLFYALNPAPWPVKATLRLEGAETIENLLTGDSAKAPVEVEIPAYHGVSFAASGPQPALAGWQAEGAGVLFARYQAHMAERLEQDGARLADAAIRTALTDEQLERIQASMAAARQALGAGRYAEAWQRLSNPDYTWLSFLLERQGARVELITENNPQPPNRGKRTITARRTASPPVINGALDEAAWQEADAQGGFIDNSAKASIIGTEARLLRDDTAVYIGFVCRDNFPDRLRTEARDETEVMQGDDALVFLLQPDMNTTRHYQMAFSAGGVKFDQQDLDLSFAPDWKVAVQVGTNGWTAEVAVPFAALETAAPAAGTTWGGNFCRLFRRNLAPFSTWRFMPGDWHNPARYGVIEFE